MRAARARCRPRFARAWGCALLANRDEVARCGLGEPSTWADAVQCSALATKLTRTMGCLRDWKKRKHRLHCGDNAAVVHGGGDCVFIVREYCLKRAAGEEQLLVCPRRGSITRLDQHHTASPGLEPQCEYT